MINHPILIIGASSKIAQSIGQLHLEENNSHVIMISRNISKLVLNRFSDNQYTAITVNDYTIDSISMVIDKLNTLGFSEFRRIYMCNGLLHSAEVQPEKKLEDFCPKAFNEVMTTNAVTPLLFLQALLPFFKKNTRCIVTVFNARVGSIDDNHLGGWYSYRASKAALNMLLKNISIEFARRAKSVKIVSFHPGTTDTPLSAPFQHNVPKGKLFNSNFVATKLNHLLSGLQPDGKLSYIDWQGETIEW